MLIWWSRNIYIIYVQKLHELLDIFVETNMVHFLLHPLMNKMSFMSKYITHSLHSHNLLLIYVYRCIFMATALCQDMRVN